MQAIKNVQTLAFTALNTFAATVQQGVMQLRTTFVSLGIHVEDCDEVVTAWAAARHNCPLVEGQRKAKGRMVLDSSAPSYEAAKKSRQRALEALTADADAKSNKSEAGVAEEIEIPAEILAAAAKLAKLCNEYEGAKKLAAKAVATAFAK